MKISFSKGNEESTKTIHIKIKKQITTLSLWKETLNYKK